jgi:hypothetical protein
MTSTTKAPLFPTYPLDDPPDVRYSVRKGAVALAIAVAVAAGIGTGAATYDTTHSSPSLTRGQVADAARLQAQADAVEEQRQAVERGRAADAARWQAQADAAEERLRAAEAATRTSSPTRVVR